VGCRRFSGEEEDEDAATRGRRPKRTGGRDDERRDLAKFGQRRPPNTELDS
jgi:hypothetical protein